MDGHGQVHRQRRTRRFPALRHETAAKGRKTFPQPQKPQGMCLIHRRVGDPDAIIGDLHGNASIVCPQGDFDRTGPCVPRNVGQRFLRSPKQ